MIFKPSGAARLAYWDDAAPTNPYIEIKIKRSTVAAFLLSFLFHMMVLFFLHPKLNLQTSNIANSTAKSISVRLAGLPTQLSKPQSIIESKANKTEIISKQTSSTEPIFAVDKPLKAVTPLNIPVSKSDATDLMSYIRNKRQQEQVLEEEAVNFNNAAIAKSHSPSADEQKDAIIKRNLQQQGTNGIFEIRSKNDKTAKFSFKGWKNNYVNSRLEIIDVEVGANGDIELAIVKSMIEIIRRDYNGDFNWESQRLGRVIVLSARIQDNAGLEEFLIREFF